MILRLFILSWIFLFLSCKGTNDSTHTGVKKIKDLEYVYLEYDIMKMNDTRTVKVKERNKAIVTILKDSILYDGKYLEEDSLYRKIKVFIKSDHQNLRLPELQLIQLPIVGNELVSKHRIVIVVDSLTDFTRYFKVRHEILKAYNTLRDDFAKEKFGLSYSDILLSDDFDYSDYNLIISHKYPIRLSESIRK